MVDQPSAPYLARPGFDNWQAGRLEEARDCYLLALANVDPVHWALSEYHGEYASVLVALGETHCHASV